MKWPWIFIGSLLGLLLLLEFSWLGKRTISALQTPGMFWAILWLTVAVLGVFLGLHLRKRMNS